MWQRAFVGSVMAVLLLAGGAVRAEAATVTRVYPTDPFGGAYGSGAVVFTAAVGEANEVDLTVGAGTVTLHDARAAIDSTACDRVDTSTVRCTQYEGISVRLGDGDDVLRVADSRALDPSLAPIWVTAGTGADTVAGGPNGEVILDAGDGEADRFNGGGGADMVSYAGRKAAVRVTVGAPGEDVVERITGIIGGNGDDVLIGSAGADHLDGGPGRDRLEGRAGNDKLSGGRGPDRLYGGGGADRLSGDDYRSSTSRDLLDGGPGNDRLDLSAADDSVFSIGGPTYDPLTDGKRDAARCGPGLDTVVWLEDHDTMRGCELGELEEPGESAASWRLGRQLVRTRGGSLRLRVYAGEGGILPDAERVVIVARRGNARRLTRAAVIRRSGSVKLRLTPAGVQYLRRARTVTIRGVTDFSGTLAATVK